MTERIRPFVYVQSDGSATTLDRIRRDAERLLTRLLTLLGEPGRSTISLQRLPDGVDFWDWRDSDTPFIQVAGAAEKMTIEWGRYDIEGEWQLSVVGRGGTRDGEPPVTILFNDGENSTEVYPDEVFEAAEAADLFIRFIDTESVPDTYALRELDLRRFQK